jgi:hypothetical protein
VSDDRQRVLSRRARFVALALASAGLAGAKDAEPPDGSATRDATDATDAGDARGAARSGIAAAIEAARAGDALSVQAVLEATDPGALFEARAAAAELEAECTRRDDLACVIALLVARHAGAQGKLPESERAAWLDRIAELRSTVARLELVVSRGSGEVLLNDVSFGSATGRRALYLKPGRYRIAQRAASADAPVTVRVVDLAAGGSASVEIESLSPRPMVCLSPPPPSERGCGCDVVGRKG